MPERAARRDPGREVPAFDQPRAPGLGRVEFELDVDLVVAAPGAEPDVAGVQTPAGRGHRLAHGLARDEDAADELGDDLRLRVAAHGARDEPQRPVRAGDQRGHERVRRAPAGPELGRVAGVEVEPDAAVLKPDPRARLEQPRPEPGRVRLDVGDAHALAVEHGHVRGAARLLAHRHVDAALSADAGRALACGGEQVGHVGAFVEPLGPVVPGQARRLHEVVRPQRVGRIGGQVEAFGDGQCQQQQVALGVRRGRPHAVAERVDAQRRLPGGLRGGQVGLGEQALALFDEPSAELAEVEPVAAFAGDGAQRRRGAPPRDGVAGDEPDEVFGALDAFERSPGGREHGGGGPAVLGQADRGRQQLGHRLRPVAPVQREPAVDAPGDGRGPDVVAEGHRRAPFGAQRLGVGAGPGPPGGVQARGRRLAGPVDEGEQVAAEAAQVRGHDRQGRSGRDGGVDGVAALGQHLAADAADERIDRTHDALIDHGPSLTDCAFRAPNPTLPSG